MQKRIVIGILGAALGALLTGCAGNSSAQHIMPIQGPDGLYYIVNNDGEAEIVDPNQYADAYGNVISDYHSYSIIGDLVIPEEIDGYKVTEIQDFAFMGQDITSVSIPDSVEKIGALSFYYCKELKSVKYANASGELEFEAFDDCSSLVDVQYNGSCDFGDVFDGTPWLDAQINKNSANEFFILNGTLIKYNGDSEYVDVPSGVSTIGSNAFLDCANIRGINLPDSIGSIGAGAFANCVNLKDISLPESVKIIRTKTFENCSSLVNIIIPDGVVYIEDRAFDSCGITDIDLPDSLIRVHYGAFNNTPLYTNSIDGDYLIVDDVMLDYLGDDDIIEIPDNVRMIASLNSWKYQERKATLVIPENVEIVCGLESIYFSEIAIKGETEFYTEPFLRTGFFDRKGMYLYRHGGLTDLYLTSPVPIIEDGYEVGFYGSGCTIHYNGRMYSEREYVKAYEQGLL